LPVFVQHWSAAGVAARPVARLQSPLQEIGMDKLHTPMRRMGLVALLVFLLPCAALAQVTRDWFSIVPNTYGDMVAVDQANNVYVVGSVPWSTILIAKYSPAGARLWQRTFDNPGTREQGSWITIDVQGNAVVTGYLVAGGDDDPSGLVVLKFDPAGNLLWQDVIPAAFGYAWRARTDSLGNVYVLGRLWVANASGNTTHDIVTLKYSPTGVRLWQRQFGFDATSADAPAALAVTPAGNVVVVGGAVGRMLMVAYDPAGNTLWSKSVAASTGALDVAVGAGGEFVIVGGTYSPAAGRQFLVLKHDAAFNLLWSKTYPVGHYAMRAAIDAQGNAIVTGVTGLYLDWMTIKLDAGGGLLWQRRYDQHQFNDEIPFAMVLGPDGAAYITGQGGPGPTSGDLGYLRAVTVKYAADGTQVWAATTHDSVRGLGVALGSDNSLAVVGESPLAVLHYTQSGGVNLPPSAIATATTATTGPAPLSVGFSATGSSDPDGTIVRTQWNFGDGTTSLQPNPSHVYAAGSYAATLTVTDDQGGATTSAPITITAQASAPPPPVPTALTFTEATVTGGRDTRATVKVSGSAGVLLTLRSSHPDVAAVPASIQVAAGSTSATFRVRTSRVLGAVAVTISASTSKASTAAVLTVVPR
jgi:PKD repeat protein